MESEVNINVKRLFPKKRVRSPYRKRSDLENKFFGSEASVISKKIHFMERITI